MGKMAQNAVNREVPAQMPADVSEEFKDQVYAFFNCQTQGPNGISIADFFRGQEAIEAEMFSRTQ